MFLKDPLANAFRRWGYLQADLDPLGRLEALPHADLDDASGDEADRWRRIYCGSVGAEFMHMHFRDRCEWVARRMEETDAVPDRRRIDPVDLGETAAGFQRPVTAPALALVRRQGAADSGSLQSAQYLLGRCLVPDNEEVPRGGNPLEHAWRSR